MKKLLLALIIPLLILPRELSATIATTMVWEVRPTNGSDSNGGCFKPGASGTDRSQQGGAFTAFTDLVIGGTTTQATSVAHPFGATDVGNCVKNVSGTGCTVGWFEVVSVAGVTATFDRSLGTAASTCTANLGGAIKTLSQLNTNLTANQGAYVKAEATIGISSAANVAGGGLTGYSFVEGYTTTRGDNGYVTIQDTATSGITILNLSSGSNAQITVRNFILDCNGQTTTTGANLVNDGMVLQNIKVLGCGSNGIILNNSRQVCRFCYVTTLSSGNAFQMNGSGVGVDTCDVCVAYDNTTSSAAFSTTNGICNFCIASNTSGTTADGMQIGTTTGPINITNSIFYNNKRDGIRLTNAVNNFGISIRNTIFENNGAFGINSNGGTIPSTAEFMDYNAFFNNTSGARSGVSAGTHDVIPTADVFVAAGSNNFALNNTASAGAALRGAGFLGALAVGGTGTIDIGTLQHADPVVTVTNSFGFVQ